MTQTRHVVSNDRRRLWVGPSPRLALEVAGAGPLVLFLHGIGGNRSNWNEQLDVIGAAYTAVAWDARGYGQSDDYPGELDFADFSQDIARVLDLFGAKSAHLVGASMGGRIALDFYARHPDRVASLVLVDTSAGSAKVASEEEIEKFLTLRKKPLLQGKTPRDIANEVAKTLIGPGTSAAVRERIVASLSDLHKESYLKTLDAVTRYTAFPPFETIRAPCLVIVGEHDRIATPQYAANMAARIEGSQFVTIEGGSHLSNMDRPIAFNRALLAFLDEYGPRAIYRATPSASATAFLRESL